MKFTLVFSLGLLVVFVVAISALYGVLSAMGVFSAVNSTLHDITDSGSGGTNIVFSAGRIIGGAIVIGGINVILFTALATLGAFLYNLCASLVGGIEVTLSEQE